MSDNNSKLEGTFVIKDLITNEVIIDNIEKHEIQESLNRANEMQKAKGVRQDRPSFYLHMK